MSRKSAAKVTIRRAKHIRKFVIVGNELAQREDISYEALGLLVHLLSRPDDWEVVLSTLQKDGCRKDKLARIVAELIDLGYVDRVQVRSSGRFGGFDYVVSEIPSPQTEKPSPVKPSPVKPSPVNPPLQRTYKESLQKTEETKKQTTTKERLLSLDILGKGDLEKFDRLKGADRVDLVCAHAEDKTNPNGWAASALKGDWELKSLSEPIVGRSDEEIECDNTSALWLMNLRSVGLSYEEAHDYMLKFPEDRYLYEGDYDRIYVGVSKADLLLKISDKEKV